jgi:ABC-type polysaccharide/polyol phosphate transport system ATPase subunit
MTWAVRFEDVSKQYRRGGPRYASIGNEFAQFAARLKARAMRREPELFGPRALDHVSFEVGEGESYALLGGNGAGKTTALRLLTRISPPTDGRVLVRGRVGALMEVGSGVHPELTGRENIWLYGSILGLPRNEIRRRFDEIVEFAELPHALETQVKYYSSGMALRLGFAIASHLEPNVFVVDEALSVGDAAFQERCMERMSKLVRSGTTLIFVSHNLASIEVLCTRGILIEKGRSLGEGPIKEMMARYLRRIEDQRIKLSDVDANNGPVRVVAATCHGLDGKERYHFAPGEGAEFRLRFECDQGYERPYVEVEITDGRNGSLIECTMWEDGLAPDAVGSEWECRLRIESLHLRTRLYQVYCSVYGSHGGRLMDHLEVTGFRVEAPPAEGPRGVVQSALGGPIDVGYSWDILT